jgi:hypothetical protein
MWHKLFFIFFISLLGCFISSNSAWGRESQMAYRLGPIAGDYSGPIDGNFFVPGGIDLEYSMFTGNSSSFFFRTTIALELPESKPFYVYAGTGIRYYLNSKATSIDRNEDDFTLSIIPTRRYYWGFDFGVSEAIVESFGTLLQAVSAMIDLGAHAGATFQISEKVGIDVLLGLSGGFGFSSVGVTGLTSRALVGMTYSF